MVRCLGIKGFGRYLGLCNDCPLAIPPSAKETVAAAGVTSNAMLVDEQQHRVTVAIEAQLAQQLDLSRGFALSPQLLA